MEQEKQTTQDLENLGEELLKEKQRLVKSLEMLQGEKDKQVNMFDVKKGLLLKTMIIYTVLI